jgi:hypothetical protein
MFEPEVEMRAASGVFLDDEAVSGLPPLRRRRLGRLGEVALLAVFR